MKTKTPFYELAERIAEDNYIGYYFADQNMDRDYYNFYYNIFAPTAKDVVRIKKELNKIVSDPNAIFEKQLVFKLSFIS